MKYAVKACVSILAMVFCLALSVLVVSCTGAEDKTKKAKEEMTVLPPRVVQMHGTSDKAGKTIPHDARDGVSAGRDISVQVNEDDRERLIEAVLRTGGTYTVPDYSEPEESALTIESIFKAGLTNIDSPKDRGGVALETNGFAWDMIWDAGQIRSNSFPATAGDQIKIRVKARKFHPDIQVLFESFGADLASASDDNGDGIAVLEARLPETGAYILQVRARGPETGVYKISLRGTTKLRTSPKAR